MTAVGINGAAFESQISSFVSVSVSQVSIAKTSDGGNFSSVLSKSFAKAQISQQDLKVAQKPAEETADKPADRTADTTGVSRIETGKQNNQDAGGDTKTDNTVKTNDSKDETVDGKEAGKKTLKTEDTQTVGINASEEVEAVDKNIPGIDLLTDADDCIKALEVLSTLMQGIADILNTTVNELQGCYDRLNLEPSTMFTVTNIQLTVITFEGLSDPSDLLVNNDALGMLNEIKNFVASVFEDADMQFTDFRDIVTSDEFAKFVGPVDLTDAADILKQFTFDENGKLVISEDNSEETVAVPKTEEMPVDEEVPEENIRFEVNVTGKTRISAHKNITRETVEEETDVQSAPVTEEVQESYRADTGAKNGEQEAQSKSQTSPRTLRTIQPGRIETPVEMFMQGLEHAVQSLELETPIADGVTVRDIVYQVVEAIRVNISNESTSLQMNLNPENLGRVSLNIESKGGVMTAQITTENEAARAAIESQLQILKDNFEAQGVRVEAIEVTVSSFSFADSKNADAQAQEHPEDNMRVGRGRRNGAGSEASEEGDDVTDEAQLAKEVMEQNGSTVNFVA